MSYDIVLENASILGSGEAMKEITLITFGLLVGWLIEWVIDWLYWRQKYNNCLEENIRLKAQVTKLTNRSGEKPSKKDRNVGASRSDDFTLISGVGPVISQMLIDAGITTFETLAAASPTRLRAVLGDLIERLADEEDLLRQAKHFAKEKKLARDAKKDRRDSKAKKTKKGKKKKKSAQKPTPPSDEAGKEELAG
jgi:predicted flap endonuclease-1-like 5' DNA nuclease